jgi:hypothetical protein
MPLERDLDFTKSGEYGIIVIPYTKEKYVQLKKITDGFEKLARAFFDFLQSDMKKLLPEMENMRRRIKD